MKEHRIAYYTAYDDTKRICGYVIPQGEMMDGYWITKRQYQNALKHRTIGGTANVVFCEKVYIKA